MLWVIAPIMFENGARLATMFQNQHRLTSMFDAYTTLAQASLGRPIPSKPRSTYPQQAYPRRT